MPRLLLLLTMTLALAPAALCQGAASDEAGRVRTRMLHLRDGSVLRTRARLDGEVWKVQRPDGFEDLPVARVVRVEREDDVLAEARKRLRRARRGDADAQAELAGWMIDEGLVVEAFRHLDELLREAPDHPRALALLARPELAPPAELDEMDRLLDIASRGPPSLQELTIARLAHAADDETLRRQLAVSLHDTQPGRRAFAARAMRRLHPGEPDPSLLPRALADPSDDVRLQAALALRAARDPELVAACLKALDHQASLVRAHAADTLAVLGQRQAVEPLMQHLVRIGPGQATAASGSRGSVFIGTQRAYVAGVRANVANNAAIADPVIGVIGEGATLDARVLGTSTATRAESEAVRSALARITGASPGSTVRAWERWWQENGDAWRAPPQGEQAATLPDDTREIW